MKAVIFAFHFRFNKTDDSYICFSWTFFAMLINRYWGILPLKIVNKAFFSKTLMKYTEFYITADIYLEYLIAFDISY